MRIERKRRKMKNEQLAMEILRELVRNAAKTIIDDSFAYWHARYYGYGFPSGYDGTLERAVTQLGRLTECFDREEINKLFDEAEECYRANIDPQVWELFKNKAAPTRLPVANR
jgi:hypothetical protein